LRDFKLLFNHRDLSDCGFLRECKRLEFLELNECAVTDYILLSQILSNLPNLNLLKGFWFTANSSFSHCDLNFDCNFTNWFTGLEYLGLPEWTLTMLTFQTIMKNSSHLKMLSVVLDEYKSLQYLNLVSGSLTHLCVGMNLPDSNYRGKILVLKNDEKLLPCLPKLETIVWRPDFPWTGDDIMNNNDYLFVLQRMCPHLDFTISSPRIWTFKNLEELMKMGQCTYSGQCVYGSMLMHPLNLSCLKSVFFATPINSR
jgi:hypothetical protein